MRLPVLLMLLAAALIAGWRDLRPHRQVVVSQAAELVPAPRVEKARRKGAGVESGIIVSAGTTANESADPLPRTPDAVRARIRAAEQGTYIDEILLSRDSALVRWPDRVERPLRVWVASGAQYPDWKDSYANRVRDAFVGWEQNGIPIRFTFAVDSTDADIHVGWVDRFDAAISGKTLWSRDKRWWIVSGTITLALHHNYGDSLDGNAIYAIALHEVGHLLGLDHTEDVNNIMTPRVRVRELSAADRATVRLLYSLPPGSIK
ncbi:MAG TPA: matrixin family metalloprotease [Gemmatimonadaceae bacterium]|nr:matrixin family metalloprotease [Gemmatimonadaceae bacterium]